MKLNMVSPYIGHSQGLAEGPGSKWYALSSSILTLLVFAVYWFDYAANNVRDMYSVHKMYSVL